MKSSSSRSVIMTVGVLLCMIAGLATSRLWGSESFIPFFLGSMTAAVLVLLFSLSLRHWFKKADVPESPSVTLLLRIAIVTVGLFLCVLGGWLLLIMTAPLWPEAQGRTFFPHVLAPAGLVASFSFGLRFWLQWKPSHILIAMIPAQFILFGCIVAQTGYDVFCPFEWSWRYFPSFELVWFLGLNLFLGLPWIGGLLFGSLLAWVGSEQDTTANILR